MMIGISPSVALFLLLVCGLILLAMIGFAYLILKSLSPSHAVQLSPPDLDAKQQNTSSPSVPSRENRWLTRLSWVLRGLFFGSFTRTSYCGCRVTVSIAI
jgi:hypothetical protein